MGKRYYCDFCDKTMVSTPNVIRTHNKGVGHQKLVQEHYQQYKDPETILLEESKKNPCLRFSTGNCPFGGICRYSHYSRVEIEELKRFVAMKKSNQSDSNQPSFEDLYQKLQDQKSKQSSDSENTVLYDKNGMTHVLPWTYNPILDTFGDNLPPSIKRFKIEDFVTAEVTEWVKFFSLQVLIIADANCDIWNNAVKLLELLNNIDDNKDLDAEAEINIYLPDSKEQDIFQYHIVCCGNEYTGNYDPENVKKILRASKKKEQNLLKAQHKRKMKEIIEFMKDHYISTNYFYKEMHRIQRQFTVKDQLREMVEYLDEPDNSKIKQKILNIFEMMKKKKKIQTELWNAKTNNLVINVLKDPFNDAVN